VKRKEKGTEFRNSTVEVLIIQLDKKEPPTSSRPESTGAYLARLQTLEPVSLSALSLDTTGFHSYQVKPEEREER